MSDAGRVIAGSAKGTRLVSPGTGTRPLGDRVKETLFAILEPDLAGAKVLDLFAGSGAGGIEAMSRGATDAVFVEDDPRACRAIAENLRRAHVSERASVVRADAIKYLRERATADGPFDVVLIDPPYAEPQLLEAALASIAAAAPALLSPEAWVVAKHFWRAPPPQASGLLASVRTRRFGETALAFYRQVDPSLADPPPGRQEAAR
jgi:16S rRNA (guanine(966)-N(2))-methyltransferase RsmD